MGTSLLVFDPAWFQRVDEFAQKYPRYRGKDVISTRYHVSNAAVACGFWEVTSENIDAVFDALEKRAALKEAKA